MDTKRKTASLCRVFGVASLLLCMLGPASADVSQTECNSPPPGTVFCEDFEGVTPKARYDDYDGNPDTENQVVLNNGPSNNTSNRVIRLRVPGGQGGTSDLLKILPNSYDALYARWYLQFEPGFNFSAPNHGGGLTAGDRNKIGASGLRPTGTDVASFTVQYLPVRAIPFVYTYYRGMYQDCTNPNGQCYGDSFPCIYDNGASYCKKTQHLPLDTMPIIQAGRWYCVEQFIDMGTPNTTGISPNGQLTLWLDDKVLGHFQDLWLRTAATLKLQNLWLSLFHHDGTHSIAGQLLDNIVVSTQRVGCGTNTTLAPPANLRIVP